MSHIVEQDLKKIILRSISEELQFIDCNYSIEKVEDYHVIVVTYFDKEYEFYFRGKYD